MSFRGDVHKFYVKLRSKYKNDTSLNNFKELAEIKEIETFYKSIETQTLKLVYYRMIKERSGSGIVPIFVSAIPWLLFLFSNQLRDFLFQEGSLLWLIFSLIYICAITLFLIVHFGENAWAALHIEIIQDIIESRNNQVK